ncbi:uncharacterized protein EI90DRAFT_3038239 [Cantharellus anzutake]|uniref:uncharacterized protein n=1 Tax=Cantharellus anzutake TaxID=1750568 RepID=UPI001904C844|nr:uncharacterized protein EI90DRAFT_3038239 [Cantharellus anzutake]KAF8339895.1 hypothetical protein EI90DRAFT_3038239 [Cantharellus anzutake]
MSQAGPSLYYVLLHNIPLVLSPLLVIFSTLDFLTSSSKPPLGSLAHVFISYRPNSASESAAGPFQDVGRCSGVDAQHGSPLPNYVLNLPLPAIRTRTLVARLSNLTNLPSAGRSEFRDLAPAL